MSGVIFIGDSNAKALRDVFPMASPGYCYKGETTYQILEKFKTAFLKAETSKNAAAFVIWMGMNDTVENTAQNVETCMHTIRKHAGAPIVVVSTFCVERLKPWFDALCNESDLKPRNFEKFLRERISEIMKNRYRQEQISHAEGDMLVKKCKDLRHRRAQIKRVRALVDTDDQKADGIFFCDVHLDDDNQHLKSGWSKLEGDVKHLNKAGLQQIVGFVVGHLKLQGTLNAPHLSGVIGRGEKERRQSDPRPHEAPSNEQVKWARGLMKKAVIQYKLKEARDAPSPWDATRLRSSMRAVSSRTRLALKRNSA